MVTIGQLAQQVGVRPSTLRYYEAEGLLQPDGRSDSGYRLYKPEGARRLRLIQRAQQLDFSLADIRTLLDGYDMGDLSDAALIKTAESRYLALEKQVTELLTLQHELQLFLQDLYQRHEPSDSFSEIWRPTARPTPKQSPNSCTETKDFSCGLKGRMFSFSPGYFWPLSREAAVTR